MAEHWAEGVFPKELIGRFRESGLVGLPYEGYGDHGPVASHLLTGMMAMEMSRVDAVSTTASPCTPSKPAATRRSATAGCPGWPGWTPSGCSRSPNRSTVPTSRPACAPRPDGTATHGCSTAPSAG
ncbi:acyl-CoA dehydrogenase family protein [Streptomyces chartreusis]|uniref:acyl-CoA dehydrogenase family protein n=1 Tax=Streptomyces chartreusis TaxID=1969 RepID=UPI0038197922